MLDVQLFEATARWCLFLLGLILLDDLCFVLRSVAFGDVDTLGSRLPQRAWDLINADVSDGRKELLRFLAH